MHAGVQDNEGTRVTSDGPTSFEEISILEDPDPSLLIWSDEFDGVDGSYDTANWRASPTVPGWIGNNNELQWYTWGSRENYSVSDGVLTLTAKKESGTFGGDWYSSGRMNTRARHAFKYGRIQFRANLAKCKAVGTWPALWMVSIFPLCSFQ